MWKLNNLIDNTDPCGPLSSSQHLCILKPSKIREHDRLGRHLWTRWGDHPTESPDIGTLRESCCNAITTIISNYTRINLPLENSICLQIVCSIDAFFFYRNPSLWQRRTALEKALTIISIVALIAIFVLVIAVIHVAYQKQESEYGCLTPTEPKSNTIPLRSNRRIVPIKRSSSGKPAGRILE